MRLGNTIVRKRLVWWFNWRKPYNWTNWEFLEFVMPRNDFEPKWRSWWTDASPQSIFYLSYGSRTAFILVTRGLREGEPPSPFLFSQVILLVTLPQQGNPEVWLEDSGFAQRWWRYHFAQRWWRHLTFNTQMTPCPYRAYQCSHVEFEIFTCFEFFSIVCHVDERLHP